jgi:hypothetical protein
MPIVDVELDCTSEADLAGISARRIADALGAIFGSLPGRTWARVRAPEGASAGITEAIAGCLGRPPERVHVRYEPAAAGRQAFGGNLAG